MKRYDGDYTETFALDKPKRDILFGAQSSIKTDYLAIYMDETATGSSIVLKGEISTPVQGIYTMASKSSIEIGEGAEIQSLYPIVGYGDAQSVTNAGTIAAGDIGIVLQGLDPSIRNDGLITAATGVVLDGTHKGLLVNGRSGEIDAVSYGVTFEGASDAHQNRLLNLGTIASNAYAFMGSSSIEHVVNRGVMRGDIWLSTGNDLFNGRGGETIGQVSGGGGDDKYLIDDTEIALFESVDNGTDTVASSADYELPANFEHLVLTGRKHLVGRGNEADNFLTGNAGNNELHGGEGDNTLAGGAGDDLLFGGGATDTFVFATGDDHDTVKNFQDNVDDFDFRHWKGLKDFDTLLSHARDRDGDLIFSYKGDQLTIENFTKAQFDPGDLQG